MNDFETSFSGFLSPGQADFTKDADGLYKFATVQLAWQSWQAALDSARKKLEGVSAEDLANELHKCLWGSDFYAQNDAYKTLHSSACEAVRARLLRELDEAPTSHPAVQFKDGKLMPPPFGEWHRQDFTPEMLEGGWRPVMLEENAEIGDDLDSDFNNHVSTWTTITGQSYAPIGNWFFRTHRPLPTPEPAIIPPEGFHIATEEERKCLPLGSVRFDKYGEKWEESFLHGYDLTKDTHIPYACPNLAEPRASEELVTCDEIALKSVGVVTDFINTRHAARVRELTARAEAAESRLRELAEKPEEKKPFTLAQPPHGTLHNPDNLTGEQVGDPSVWRLLLTDEVMSMPHQWRCRGEWLDTCEGTMLANYYPHTYRVRIADCPWPVKPEPSPDADGWIPHTPGDPCPVPGETLVRYKMRMDKDAMHHGDQPEKAGCLHWCDMHGESYEIIAYRIVTPETTPVAEVAAKITTTHVFPPIPIRSCDWSACYEGREEQGPFGWGATEAEAIADLKDNHEAP